MKKYIQTMFNVDLPTVLRYRRKTILLNQTEFAELVGIRRPRYAAYEEGRAEPSLEILIKFSITLGFATLDDFLNIKTKPQKEKLIQIKYDLLPPEKRALVDYLLG